MRSKPLLPQRVTVRPLDEQSIDVFGDAPVVAPRSRSFTVPMSVTWMTRAQSEPGAPGRESRDSAVGIVTKAVCDENGWTPRPDDIIVPVDGTALFVRDVQPDDAQPIRLGRPNGSWGAWRLTLSSSAAERRGATIYE